MQEISQRVDVSLQITQEVLQKALALEASQVAVQAKAPGGIQQIQTSGLL
jgi:hypothetical protein